MYDTLNFLRAMNWLIIMFFFLPDGHCASFTQRQQGWWAIPAQRQPQQIQQPRTAKIELISANEEKPVAGTLYLSQIYSTVHIRGVIRGLEPGKHGFHIHATGDLGDGCKAAGGHFNPFNVRNGS